MDRRLGIDRVQGPAFTLNSATDTLLKKEYDAHRVARTPHPLFAKFGIDAIPYAHLNLDSWRDALRNGIQFLHGPTNLLLTGGIDDVWEHRDGSLAIVDYKSTCTAKEISLDDPWKQAYKRQMEIYQWLFRRNGFNISHTGYFLFVNADTERDLFGDTLIFKSQIIAYDGDDSWVERALINAHICLCGDFAPAPSAECDWCAYRIAGNGNAAQDNGQRAPST